MNKVFLWIEDRKDKSGYVFWKTLMEQIYPEVTVESKMNCSELVKAVGALTDSDSTYIVVLDNSFNNPQITVEQKMMKQYVAKKKNVFLLDIICFEYLLLEFDELLSWIYAAEDEFLIKRAKAIEARNKLVVTLKGGIFDYADIREIVDYLENVEEYNIEQLAARLLFDLTRNTGFEVSKGSIGGCWIKSCCEWEERQEDDICGLDDNRLNLCDKMKHIYEGTCLKEEFSNIGLEMAS